jgi:hypothetical protein
VLQDAPKATPSGSAAKLEFQEVLLGMRNHPVFERFDLEEDSCIVAAHRAEERYRQRLRTERKDEEPTESSRYEANDDLPE